ncbi:MAG TPA: AAA family ATPase, partial [Polyangiaceae bacterium]|nr:AAA family ATPase [Polyangiaceae bacterium]
GPFRRHVSIDLASIPGLLIAVTGGNGQGKSTLLECLGGALYRTTPTRGSLADLAIDRNAFIEARVVNGKSWTLRHTVDAISGKGESLVLDAAGDPQLPSGKVKEFDAWAAVHLPSPEVLYSSSFAPQGSGGFLEMKAGERKGVLLRVLGIEALEGKADRARERSRAAKQALEVLAARIADERARGGDIAAAEKQLAEATAAAENAEFLVIGARGALEREQERAESVRLKLEEFRQARAQNDDLARQRNEAAAKADELRARIANNQKVLDESGAILAAVARVAAIDSETATLKVDEAELDQKRLGHERDAEATARRCNEASKAIADVEQRLRRAAARFADRAAIEKAVAELPTAKALDEEDEHAVRLLAGDLDAARAAGLDLAAKRLLELRPFVDRVANDEIARDDIVDTACDVIAEDNRLVQEATDAPSEVKRLAAAMATLHDDVAKRRARVRELESLAGRAGELASAKADLEEASAALDRHRAELSEATEANVAARAGQLDLGRQLIELRDRIYRLTSERDGLKGTADKAGPLATAETRIAELRPQLDELEAKALEINERMKPLSWCLVDRPPDPVDARPFVAAVETAEQEARTAAGMIKVAEARLESARLTRRKLGELEGQRGGAEGDLADWTLLADSLGREGIQALEIDAAGPELTELINDLLRTCVGSRWTVTVETQRLSSDGKKQIEGCEVRVLDTERGRDGTAESLSGGERVLVGEAVSLALSMLACRRSGVQGPTLIRDESGAALDPANARNYVAMLRRAAELVGASHVLFVSHSLEVQELADARIEIKDGEVTVAA